MGNIGLSVNFPISHLFSIVLSPISKVFGPTVISNFKFQSTRFFLYFIQGFKTNPKLKLTLSRLISDPHTSLSHSHSLTTHTVFGWSENREGGKHRVENSVFHCLANERKSGGRKTREKVFSPGPTIFILPNREENLERKVLWKHFYPNTLSQRPQTSTTTQRGKIRRQKITTKPSTTPNTGT